MAFSVAKRRPFRVFGLYRSSGKHAAPRGIVQRSAVLPRRPAHAASMPRLTGPHSAEHNKAA
jgi:hypothetical protein